MEWQKAWDRPIVSNPGSSWQYGPGIDWAGKVLEILTKQTLEQYMEENIWSKIGMVNTTFHPEKRKAFKMLSMGTRLSGGAENPLIPRESPWPVPAPNDMGGCGLYSTAEDYAKFLAALLSDDSPLLSQETLAELVKPQLSKSSIESLLNARELGLVQCDIPKSIRVDHALAGLIVKDDIPGRRRRGSVCWDGMTNPNWVSEFPGSGQNL
jgi:CubicO group peptidase (beta-lactamase class C family)